MINEFGEIVTVFIIALIAFCCGYIFGTTKN